MTSFSSPPILFLKTSDSKNTKNSSPGLPPFSKRAFVAFIAVVPMAFGINIPLNSMFSFVPVWGVIMINAIVISAYMTFIMPRASKLLASWLNSTKVIQMN